MCQHYRWTCGACGLTQDCLSRCAIAQQHRHCARTVTPLPLPRDAPPMLCQQCGCLHTIRNPTNFSSGNGRLRTHSLRSRSNASHLPEPCIPPSDDVFWLQPCARLPDLAQTLVRYDKERSAILQHIQELPREAQNGDNFGDMHWAMGDSTMQSAWAALRRAMSSGESKSEGPESCAQGR